MEELKMEELRTEEIMGTVVEEAAEAVVEKGGLTLGKAATGVGVVALLATGGYFVWKKIKNKKAKKEAEAALDTVKEADFEDETIK